MSRVVEWEGKIRKLEALRETVAIAMRSALEKLEAGQVEIPPDLPRLIEDLCARFREVRDEILAAAADLGIQLVRAESLEELAEVVRHIRETEEAEAKRAWSQARDRVLELLDRVSRLTYKGGGSFEPLELAKNAAQGMAEAIRALNWPEIHTEQSALIDGSHPLAALLRLVEAAESLSDDECTQLGEIVGKAFGASLTTAALRGRIVPEGLARDGASQALSAQELEPTAELESQPEGERPRETQTVGDSAVRVEEPVATQQALAESAATAEPPVAVMEGAEAPKAEQEADLGVLVWKLVRSERLALAFHLAEYCEHEGLDRRPWLPSWLLRTVILGLGIEDAHSDLVPLLQEDLGRFGPDCFEAGRADFNWGVRLIAAAGSLRPAILAPQTGAAAVLRQLHTGELGGLFQYCRRIAEFGEKNVPVSPKILRGLQGLAACQAEIAKLQDDVRRWWSQAPTFTMKYAPATKVWREWLRKDQPVEQLVRPILANDESAGPALADLLAKLGDTKQVDRLIRQTDQTLGRPAGSEITAEARTQLHRQLAQAVSFARNWLDLLDSRNKIMRSDFVHRQTKQLRDDLAGLAPTALADLEGLRSANPGSVYLEAGVDLCRKAIESVQRCFDPQESSAPEPRLWDLLYAEVLHVPGLRLGSQGDVIWQNVDQVVSVLEEFSRGNQPCWEATFERLCEEGRHEDTARVIDHLRQAGPDQPGLDIDAFEQRRERSLEEWQRRLREELVTANRELEQAVSHGILGEQ